MGSKKLQKLIDRIRQKPKKRIMKFAKNNNISVCKEDYEGIFLNVDGENNNIKILKSNLKNRSEGTGIFINIFGCNNTIEFEEMNIADGASIALFLAGDNNKIVIKKGFSLDRSFCAQMGSLHYNFDKIHNSSIFIDENVNIQSLNYYCYTSNTPLNIGKNSMIAFDVDIYNTDAHPVLDFETKKVINKVYGVEIGAHCWVGAKSSILKNVKIPNDCIIGFKSVVTSSINKTIEPNCAVGGNPAKVVKRGVIFDACGKKYNYADNEVEENE